MPKTIPPKTIAVKLAGAALLLTTLVAAIYALDRAAAGRLGFYIWKTVSNRSPAGQYAEINGVRIYFETFGEGRPVLVLHGGLGSLEDMERQIRALAKERLVIAVDSRAHGRSSDSEAPLGYALMADDMVKLLDELKIGQVDVVGWSDGGIIGLDLAMRHPDRIGRLVAISANYDVDGLVEIPKMDARIPSAPGAYTRDAPDPAHWPVFYRKVATMWRTQPNYTLAELARIKAPTLVMAGQFDAIKREHSDQLAKAIPGSQETIVEGGTHLLPIDKPDIVNASILKFLDEEPR
jgi:pimeloyl-ACP methyl ester carboxylesterase